MQNYLILYVDMEFIVGAIGTGYGNPHIINTGGDILQWLYFFNDPHQHEVSFGKRYKRHFMDGEVNYYGRFFCSIENDEATFSLRHTDYPLIDLVEVSGMLKLWKSEYSHHTQSVPDKVPTLLAFSSSIGDLAKQKFVDYLKNRGFGIESYTIPLAELAFWKLTVDGKINPKEGMYSMMIEATNATLHFTKLVYHDRYFLKDGDVKSIQGKGIDPRKRALCKFLVGEMNSLTGLLSTEEEKEEEIERLEPQAADWLKRIDAQSGNRPFIVRNLSFRRAKHITKDILVNKGNLESDTGRYLRYLIDEYNAFKDECCSNGIKYCCFVGNCFLSDRIREEFESIIGRENCFFFKTTDVADIISVYPRIDLQRYADEEGRIKAKAEAEAAKQQQEKDAQQKREEAKAKEADAEKRKLEEERRKTEASSAYLRALDLDRQGNLADAAANMDNAVNLAPENLDYRKFADYLSEKIKKQKDTVALYKKYLSSGDKYFEKQEFEKALVEYGKAKEVDDNAEIRGKIIECNVGFKQQMKQKEKIEGLLIEIEDSLKSRNLFAAERKIGEVLSLDPKNTTAKKFSDNLHEIKNKIEKEKIQKLAELKKQLNDAMFAEDWKNALHIADEYLKIQEDDEIKLKKTLAQEKVTIPQKQNNPTPKKGKLKSPANGGGQNDGFFSDKPEQMYKPNRNSNDDFFSSDCNAKSTKQKQSSKGTNDDFDF